jgi:DNA-damage-inducible protein D
LENEVVKNSKATRKTLLIRGIKPEELEAEEDLKRIEKRKKREDLLIIK